MRWTTGECLQMFAGTRQFTTKQWNELLYKPVCSMQALETGNHARCLRLPGKAVEYFDNLAHNSPPHSTLLTQNARSASWPIGQGGDGRVLLLSTRWRCWSWPLRKRRRFVVVWVIPLVANVVQLPLLGLAQVGAQSQRRSSTRSLTRRLRDLANRQCASRSHCNAPGALWSSYWGWHALTVKKDGFLHSQPGDGLQCWRSFGLGATGACSVADARRRTTSLPRGGRAGSGRNVNKYRRTTKDRQTELDEGGRGFGQGGHPGTRWLTRLARARRCSRLRR